MTTISVVLADGRKLPIDMPKEDCEAIMVGRLHWFRIRNDRGEEHDIEVHRLPDGDFWFLERGFKR